MSKRQCVESCRFFGACFVLLFVFSGMVFGGQQYSDDVVDIVVEAQHAVIAAGGESALAVRFEPKGKWHFYASEETAPGGTNLKINLEPVDGVTFGEVRFPGSQKYFDEGTGQEVDVFGGKFVVYVPFKVGDGVGSEGDLKFVVGVDGAICSDMQCRFMPGGTKVSADVKLGAVVSEAKFELPDEIVGGASEVVVGGEVSYGLWFALGLAFLAGLTLNIMPCVWPVLPIVVLRIVDQAKKKESGSLVMGIAFCVGILVFFAGLAVANAVLHLFYGSALQWGDQFRNPDFVAGMGLLMVVLALFMFDVFAVTLPNSVSSNSGGGGGFASTVGMGVLAAILSTPCSFGILAAAFAWAQGQPLVPATLVIMMIGVGMGVPYLVLTSMPKVLKKLPKPGKWMELIKQTVGFILLAIAIKLMGALPADRKMRVIYFAVGLSFCVWMWGGWVSFSTKRVKKYIIRLIAVGLAVWMGVLLLPAPEKSLVAWEKYDGAKIEAAQENGQAVLMKFTADWCLSCQTVEKVVYGREDIAELLKEKDVLVVKGDTTVSDYAATKALKGVYNEPGVPVSILLLPDGESLRWRGINFGDSLKEALETQLK